MLKHIEIINYKSIAHCSLSFSDEVVIVGPNGVGKSNLFDAMNFLRDAAVEGLDHAVTKRHGIESVRRWSKTRPYHISLKVKFERKGGKGEYRLVISSARGDFEVHEEEAIWSGADPFQTNTDNEHVVTTRSFSRSSGQKLKFEIPSSPIKDLKLQKLAPTDLALSLVSPSSPSYLGFFFEELFKEITDCGAYSIYPNRIREPQAISNADVLADDGSNLASIIRQMRSTTYRSNKERLTTSIQKVLPIVQEIRIESAGGFFVPVFRVRETENGYAHDLNMSQVSDGTLRMLGMLTAFYQPKAPNRITLEEPEQMIHPGLLPILVDAGRDFLDISEDKQLFYTTHSPTLLDTFNANQIIACSFEDGTSSFAKMSGRQIKLVQEHLFTPGELLVTEGILG